MTTVKFNTETYNLVPFGGDSTSGKRLIFTIIKGDKTVESISSAVVDCDDIIVTEYDDETGDIINIRHYYNYTTFEMAVYIKDYIIGDDESGEEPVPITADVVQVTLIGVDVLDKMQDEIDHNTANIDYIAMETGIDLEV